MSNNTIRTGILLTADASGAITQVKLTDDELKKLNNTQANSRVRARELTDQWKNTAKQAALMGTAALTAAGYIAKSNIDTQDSYAKTSQRVAVAVETLVGYTHAANLAGVSNEQLTVGLRQLNKNVLDFKNGTGEAQVAFKGLGIEVTDANGKLKANDRIMSELADRFANMEDGAEKTGYAMRIFGESGAQLIPLLNQGSQGLASMVAEGQRLNPVTAESAAQAERFNDSLTRLKGEVNAVATSLVNELLPGLADTSEQIVDMVRNGELDVWLNRSKMAAEALSIVMVTRLVGASISAAAAQGQLTTATLASTAAFKKFTALLGGPWGVAITAAAGATYLLVERQKQAAEAAQEHALAIASVTDNMGAMSEAQLVSAAISSNEAMNALRAEIAELEESERGRTKHTEAIRKLNLELDAQQSNYETLVRQLRRVQDGWKPVTGATNEQTEAVDEQASALWLLNNVYNSTTLSANAYVSLMESAGATFDNVKDDVRDLGTETKELQEISSQASEAMIRDWQNVRQSFGEFFADMVLDGSNAFDALLKSWQRTALQMAGSSLFDMGASALGMSIPGGQSAGNSFISSAAGAAGSSLVAGAGGLGAFNATTGFWSAPSMIAPGAGAAGAGGGFMSGIGGAIGAIPGWGWALAGLAGAAALLSEKSTPSSNEGFFLDSLPGVGGQFNVDPFKSGLNPVGFTRRGSESNARDVIDLFRGLDSTTFNLLAGAGISVSTNRGTFSGLDERGLGTGLFFGAAGEEGKPGMSLDKQLEMYFKQMLASVADQLDPGDYQNIISASGVDNMIRALEQALEPATKDASDSITDFSKAANDAGRSFGDLAADMTRSIQTIMDAERDRLEDLSRLYQEQHKQRVNEAVNFYNTQNALAQKLRGASIDLRLGSHSPLNNAGKFGLAQSLFRNTLSSALGGDMGAAGDLDSVAKQYAQASSGYFASSADHKGIMAEILDGLEAAAVTSEPKQSLDEVLVSLDRELVLQMQSVNAQLATLPSNIALSLSPILTGFILQSQAAGTPNKVIANTIRNNGPEIAGIANESFNNFVGDNATPDAVIKGYVKSQRDQYGVSRESLMNIRSKAISLGISGSYIGSLFGADPQETQTLFTSLGVPSFMGGGFTGNGPRVGGVDGRGGFLSTLHPNETVIDHEKGGGNQGIVTELRALREELRQVKQVHVAGYDYLGEKQDSQIQAFERISDKPEIVGAVASGR